MLIGIISVAYFHLTLKCQDGQVYLLQFVRHPTVRRGFEQPPAGQCGLALLRAARHGQADRLHFVVEDERGAQADQPYVVRVHVSRKFNVKNEYSSAK